MFNMVYIEGNDFAKAAQTMSERLEKLGPMQITGAGP